MDEVEVEGIRVQGCRKEFGFVKLMVPTSEGSTGRIRV